MDVMEFANKHLTPYVLRGDEIIPDLCPFCFGGGRRDRGTFALNKEKLIYNCKRGSCNRSGTFWQLCREFGEIASYPYSSTTQAKVKSLHSTQEYIKPQARLNAPTKQAEEYLASRGISEATMKYYRVCSDEHGNIIFPFYENGDAVFLKYRPARKVEPGENKTWRERDTKPVLFGMDQCSLDQPLCIFEGEIDAMSGHEAGIPNCVSVPSGSQDLTWIETCWDWLQSFRKIYIFGDNDEPGRDMIHKISVRLADYALFDVTHLRKDANEMLTEGGPESIRKAYEEAKEIPPAGLISLADVRPLDVRSIPSCPSGIQELDRVIGGFMMGDLSVWTGKRGEGKSTLLGQLILEAADADEKVCAYSGEIAADRFQYWLNLQAAGREYILTHHDQDKNRDIYYVEEPLLHEIREWYRGRIWLFDNVTAKSDEADCVLSVFENVAKRYGCTVFVVDNLMTCAYEAASDANYYRAQSSFVGKLIEFARRYGVHVHLVAHPRKTAGGIENDDVAGSSDITNRAANVFSLERLNDIERLNQGCDTVLKILKNRWEGATGTIGLNYCRVSKRLYMPSVGDIRRYGWGYKQAEMTEVDIEMPF